MSAFDWDRVAPFYALQHRLEAPALRAAVELAAVHEAERVVDVATGTGAWLRHLAAVRPRPVRVVGVDRSAAMLRRARGLPPAWTTSIADATDLPFDDASFDVAAACYLLHVVGTGTRARILRELHRVLVPGGRLVTVTPETVSGTGSPVARLVAVLARHDAGARAGLRPLDPRELMARQGLTPVRVLRVTRGYPSLVVLARRA